MTTPNPIEEDLGLSAVKEKLRGAFMTAQQLKRDGGHDPAPIYEIVNLTPSVLRHLDQMPEFEHDCEVERLTDLLASKDEEIERLRLAICGGEDAPGYAMSLPLQAILDVAAQNIRSWFSASDEAQSTEARNVSLSLENEGLRKALGEGRSVVSGLLDVWPVDSVPPGPLCVRAAQFVNGAALSPPPPEGLEGKQGLSSSREPSPSTCAAPVASDVAGQQRSGAEQ